jgi:hypothetical protein
MEEMTASSTVVRSLVSFRFNYVFLLQYHKQNVPVAEVTGEFTSSCHILHDVSFQESNEEEDLEESLCRDGVRTVQSSPSVGVRIEAVTSQVDRSWQVDSCPGDDVTQERQLADPSVLQFDVSQPVEVLLVAIGHDLERVEESGGFK